MRRLSLMLATTMVLAFSSASWAALFDRGGGLIYDSTLNITWLQDANADGLMSWSGATAWAANLTYGGYSDWRLPTTPYTPGDLYIFGLNGSGGGANYGYNFTDSEMGYMFYVNLGNDANPGGVGSTNTGIFSNLQLDNYYWSGTAAQPGDAFSFSFFYGNQNPDNIFFPDPDTALLRYAWAVRDGDVAPVPEPSTMILLGSGLVGLIGYGRRRMKK